MLVGVIIEFLDVFLLAGVFVFLLGIFSLGCFGFKFSGDFVVLRVHVQEKFFHLARAPDFDLPFAIDATKRLFLQLILCSGDPRLSDFGFSFEQSFISDDKVGEFPFFDRACFVFQSKKFRGIYCHCVQCRLGSQATLDRFCYLLQIVANVIQSTGSKTEINSGVSQSRRVFGSQIPMHHLFQ